MASKIGCILHSFFIYAIIGMGVFMIPKRIIYCWFGGKEKLVVVIYGNIVRRNNGK